MLINMVRPMQVDAKELRLHMKVCDQFCGQIVDQNGQNIGGTNVVGLPLAEIVKTLGLLGAVSA